MSKLIADGIHLRIVQKQSFPYEIYYLSCSYTKSEPFRVHDSKVTDYLLNFAPHKKN